MYKIFRLSKYCTYDSSTVLLLSIILLDATFDLGRVTWLHMVTEGLTIEFVILAALLFDMTALLGKLVPFCKLFL